MRVPLRRSARRRLATHLAGNGLLSLRAAAQPVDHARDICGVAVLAELALGLEAIDRQLDPHDRAYLRVDVLAGSVINRPWLGASRFMTLDESLEVASQP